LHNKPHKKPSSFHTKNHQSTQETIKPPHKKSPNHHDKYFQ